jgi:ABC-type Fe3+-hydroxamate transport system substrate-binding protein
MRVVSLVPSVTETLLAWGIVPIGVTRFCEQPSLPQVGGTKDPNVAAIVALEPELVVVCDEENRLEDADELTSAGLALHVLRIRSVEDVGPSLAQLAERLGVRADHVVLPAPPGPDPSVRAFVPIWRERGGAYTTINGDTYGASVLRWIGVANVYAGEADRYPPTTLAEAAGRHPDVVLAPSEPYPFSERHRGELSDVAPVVFVDGQDLFWWGVRTPAAIGRLTTGVASVGARRRP